MGNKLAERNTLASWAYATDAASKTVLWSFPPPCELRFEPNHAHQFAQVRELGAAYFLNLPGELVKTERRTTIKRVAGIDAARESEDIFILKTYRYFAFSRLRTLLALSKAEREFDALTYCRSIDVPTVEPVAYGCIRTRLGMVDQCFVLTRYQEGYRPLRDWLKAGHAHSLEGKATLQTLLSEIGSHLRELHNRRFFLFSCSAKDILIHVDDDSGISWKVIDLPYARFLRLQPFARVGQRRDLGALVGTVSKYAGEDALEAFYDAYLPDPLGASEKSLRRRIRRRAKIHNKQTPWARFKKFVKRRCKAIVGRDKGN